MNIDINKSAKCYGLYDEKNIIGFIAIIHQVHSINKKIKRVHRLVILPDYQGIGLGYKLVSFIAQKYSDEGYDVSIVTSARNLIMKLYNSDKWILQRLGVNKGSNQPTALDWFRDSMRTRCKTATFFYKKLNVK